MCNVLLHPQDVSVVRSNLEDSSPDLGNVMAFSFPPCQSCVVVIVANAESSQVALSCYQLIYVFSMTEPPLGQLPVHCGLQITQSSRQALRSVASCSCQLPPKRQQIQHILLRLLVVQLFSPKFRL